MINMLDILSFLPHKRKQSESGWISFNAVCCTHNGESPDTRGRGGLITHNSNDWAYHCFNCNFHTGFTLGKSVGIKARRLMGWLGVNKKDIDTLTFDSLRFRSMDDRIAEHSETITSNISFDEIRLPESARLITKDDTKYVDYLSNRGLRYNQYKFMITPNDKFRNKNRIIIPYTNNNKVVGYTSRFLDNHTPKYINEQQQGYIFGLDLQNDKWKYVILVEGILDAISINGVAVMHNKISDEQAQQLKQLHKTVIVVPDHDGPGLKLIDDAIKYDFNVSIPKWGDGIKDVNDAVAQNGKISTLLAIIKNSMSPLKVQLFEKNKLRKKIERLQ
jgi:hypothetical protein